MVQGKIFGPQRRTERVVGRWTMLRNDELHKFVLPQTAIIIFFHVCTVHQQYQNTFLLFQLMHTIIKSQEC